MEKFKTLLRRDFAQTRALLSSVPGVTMALFVVSVVGMNLLANKSIDTGVDWLALDAGILLSWLSFLTMDITVRRFGPKAAIKISFIAAAINLLLALVLFAASRIPGFWGESFVDEGGELINSALDKTIASTWYVVLGSTVAFLCSAVVNSVLNWALGKALKSGGFGAFAVRSYVSTMVGQFVDNFLFALIVSLNFFGWSIVQCITCSVTGMLVELVCEVVFSPLGYRVARRWEKEGIGSRYLALLAEEGNGSDASRTSEDGIVSDEQTGADEAESAHAAAVKDEE